MLSAQRRIRCLPTLVEPVKLTLRITWLAISVVADQAAVAVDQLGDALGDAGVGERAEQLGGDSPGVSCGGREITVQPAASAALTFLASR